MQDKQMRFPENTAAGHGLANCQVCHHLTDNRLTKCAGCGAKISLRKPYSIQKTLALLFTSILFYIPANVLPIMQTQVLGNEVQSSIISGVLLFLDEGAYFVASVIFFASIVIPITKMIAIYWLCYNVSFRQTIKKKELTKLYALTEFIGKWSMIDVFVVAILVALIQVGNLMVITPGIAAASFAVVVILTMFSAQCFDARLLWDKSES